MKQKRADMSDWHHVIKSRFLLREINDEAFQGYASLFYFDEIDAPLWMPIAGERVCVVNNGYSWLQLFPRGSNHVATITFDAQDRVHHWYIDISKRTYMDEQGMLWYDDLYLDLIFLPGGDVELLDEDELNEAYAQGIISTNEYNLAWNETRALMTQLEEQSFPLLPLAAHYKARLETQISV